MQADSANEPALQPDGMAITWTGKDLQALHHENHLPLVAIGYCAYAPCFASMQECMKAPPAVEHSAVPVWGIGATAACSEEPQASSLCRRGDQHKPCAGGRCLLAAESGQHSLPGNTIPDIQQVSAVTPGIRSAGLRAFHERSRVTPGIKSPGCLYLRICQLAERP